MSYRTIKRLLGETNFELKCLLLFGVGSTLLAVLTLIVYWMQTSNLIEKHNIQTARQLVAPIILETHWKHYESQPEFENLIQNMAGALRPDELANVQWRLFEPYPNVAEASERPSDDEGYEAITALQQSVANGKLEEIRKDPESDQYQIYCAILAAKSCLDCHVTRSDGDGGEIQEGDMIGVAKISLPLENSRSALHRWMATATTAEFIKVVIAILGIYLVVRYVITKPVLHLQKVSDAIAHGNLDMRADIRTGDEFEELSHAFNRMLRHLVTVQGELQTVNADLDGKVDELAQVNLRLYEMNNLKNEFLATMSHELRTPLNSILGFSEVLADADNLNDKQQRYVSNIQSSGRQLMALINDVLDLAKIESGKMELHAVEFSLVDFVERQISTMMPLAEKKNIELTWEVDERMTMLFQDAGKLQQVTNNLLSNAIKFTPEGGRVRVTAWKYDDSQVEIRVADTGIGIPLEDQATIFEKFRQGKSIPGQRDALTRKFEGTGLGLSIVKELTKLLGGEVSLESEFGKGSTFAIVIPERLDKQDEQVAAEDDPQTVGVNRFTTSDLGFAGVNAKES